MSETKRDISERYRRKEQKYERKPQDPGNEALERADLVFEETLQEIVLVVTPPTKDLEESLSETMEIILPLQLYPTEYVSIVVALQSPTVDLVETFTVTVEVTV